MIRTAIYILLIFSFFSCEDEMPEFDNEQNVLLLKEVYRDSLIDRSYNYTADSLQSQETIYRTSGSPIFIIDYEYINDKEIMSSTTYAPNEYLEGTKKYTILDPNTRKIEMYDDYGELRTIETYDNLQNECGSSGFRWQKLHEEVDWYYKIEYLDEFCSERWTLLRENEEEWLEREYIRNSKNDAYNSTLLPFQKSKNQIISYSRFYIESGDPIEEESYISEIVYNEFDYPVEEVRTYLDGKITRYTFVYY